MGPYVHVACGATVIGTPREIITRPRDKQWPRDVTMELPFCLTCQKLVEYKEIECRSANEG